MVAVWCRADENRGGRVVFVGLWVGEGVLVAGVERAGSIL